MKTHTLGLLRFAFFGLLPAFSIGSAFAADTIDGNCAFGKTGSMVCHADFHTVKIEPRDGRPVPGGKNDYLRVSCEAFRSRSRFDRKIYDGPITTILKPGADGRERVVDTLFHADGARIPAIVLVFDYDWGTLGEKDFDSQLAVRIDDKVHTLNGRCGMRAFRTRR